MALDPDQFRRVITDTLQMIMLTRNETPIYSESATELLLMTAAHESNLSSYIYQVEGPALGAYQMEPATLDDIWTNYLSGRAMLRHEIVAKLKYIKRPENAALATDLKFATIMARVHYLRDKQPLPKADDVEALAAYAKRVWNTEKGKATVEDYIGAYNKLVLKKKEKQNEPKPKKSA